MTTTTTTAGTASRVRTVTAVARRLALAGAALATVAGATLGAAGSAEAYTITTRSNVPVFPTIYQVQGAHYNIGTPASAQYVPWIYQSGPVASRVGAGAQTVRVTYTVDRWTGSAWALHATRSGSASIPSTLTSVKLPNLSLTGIDTTAGYYRVRTVALTWTSPIGAVIGSTTVAMNASGDYTCSVPGPCTAYAGYVWVG